MNYRPDKYGNMISVLGFGCMRFPRKMGKIRMKETEREVLEAIKGGINYFDTAYIYPGSESALGEILHKNGVREKVHIATKLPHYLVKSIDGLEKMFSEELKRLKTDYVDYYLMHMLTDTDTWERLKGLGIEKWLSDKKAAGKIRQIGFSYHGNSDMFIKLLGAYDWDMCLIQYNYLDEHSQAGRRGLHFAHDKGIAVMIMEPLRGGKLVKRLPENAKKAFSAHSIHRTPAEWAFKWLFNQEEITCVLSGMNSMEMLKENMKTAAETVPGELTHDDFQMIERVKSAINENMKVGCTGCGYCMPCPKRVDIPGTFAAYNRRYSDGKFWSFIDYVICTALRRNSTAASNCIECGKCEKHCPQGIKIRQELKNASLEFEGPLYRFVRFIAKKLVRF
ncbi:MAG: aldo/keto reductase [Clostridia bacterium]|nr:aldo/keto reductase [Clostridia bacterium]